MWMHRIRYVETRYDQIMAFYVHTAESIFITNLKLQRTISYSQSVVFDQTHADANAATDPAQAVPVAGIQYFILILIRVLF